MAVAFDSASSATTGGSTTNSLSWSHTCSGSDRYLVVHVRASGSYTVTYAGVSMTQLGTATTGVFFGLVNPSTGTNTIAVTKSASPIAFVSSATSYTGVHPTTPVGTISSATQSSGTAPSLDATSQTDGMVIGVLGWSTAVAVFTSGAGQTHRVTQLGQTSNLNSSMQDTEPGATSVTMSYTQSPNTARQITVIPIVPKPTSVDAGPITTSLGQSSLTGLGASVSATSNATVTTSLGQSSLTGLGASVAATKNATVTTSLGQSSLTGLGASVSASTNANINTSLGQLTATGLSVSVSATKSATVVTSIGETNLTGLGSSVAASSDATVTTSLGSTSLTGLSATVSTGSSASVVTSTGSITATGLGVSVSATKNPTITTSLGSTSLTGLGASVAASSDATVTTSLGSTSLTGLGATVAASQNVSPIVLGIGLITFEGLDTIVRPFVSWDGTASSSSTSPSVGGVSSFAGGSTGSSTSQGDEYDAITVQSTEYLAESHTE